MPKFVRLGMPATKDGICDIAQWCQFHFKMGRQRQVRGVQGHVPTRKIF